MDRALGERVRPAPQRAHRTGAGRSVEHPHAAAVVGSDDELIAVALPYLTDGLQAGDLVVLSSPPETAELIGSALGAHADGVTTDRGVSLLGTRAPDALANARRYLDQAAGRPSGRMRILAAVDFGKDPAGWREGQRFESAFNRFMVGTPVSAVCVYDRRRLPPSVVDSVAATHPELVDGRRWSPSPGYQDPYRYVASLPAPHEPAEDHPPVFAVDDAPTLAGLRHGLGAALAACVPDREQREDLHLATSEVAANAFRHGARPVSARVWSDGRRVVCRIADRGRRFGDVLAGFQPFHGDDLGRGGMGLWLARKLWDSVDLLPGPDGLTVRLSTALR